MGYVILLLTVGVTIYALVDCWNSTEDEVRGLPRLAWLLAIILFPLLAAGAYLAVGRQRGQSVHVARSRVIAPDDDPEFLRKLDQQRHNAVAEERRRREQQLRRERKERQERQQRKERQDDHDGEDHSGHPTS